MLPPLLRAWPTLNQIPRAPLAQLPTPLRRYPQFARTHAIGSLSIKHDNQTNALYGGNKIRKLEYLLGQAVAQQRTSVVTVGYAGSNFCLAATLMARQLGIQNHVFLLPQVKSEAVQKNLLLNHAAGAKLHHYAGEKRLIAGIVKHSLLTITKPSMRIGAGGSDPLGVLGFVNAAFEAAEQFEPDYRPTRVYLALGSMGSVAGLAIGFAALGLLGSHVKNGLKLVCSRVVPEEYTNAKALRELLRASLEFLQADSPGFPVTVLDTDEILSQIQIRDEFFGREYGDRSRKAVQAIEIAQDELEMKLDATYSAKAFAALLDDAANRHLHNQHVLFWNTYNSQSLDALATQLNSDNPSLDRDLTVSDLDYRQLPKAFWHYFA